MNAIRRQQRAELLQSLRAQRQTLWQGTTPPPGGLRHATANSNSFPRSMTMRLLTRRHSLAFLLVAELAPLVLRLLSTHTPTARTDAASDKSSLLRTPANG